MGRVAYCPRGMSPIPLPKHDAYVLRTNSGSLAMFAAILLASSFVSNLAAESPVWIIRIINVCELLSVRVPHDVVVRLEFGRPGSGKVTR